jgi:hypothetical protein
VLDSSRNTQNILSLQYILCEGEAAARWYEILVVQGGIKGESRYIVGTLGAGLGENQQPR